MPKTFEIRNDVFVTGSVASDEKELREYFRANIDKLMIAFDECKKLLNVKNYSMLINNIRKKNTLGVCISAKNTISIDIRRYNLKDIVSTIIHEMTHAQQFETKKLSHKNAKISVFENKEYKVVDNNKDHDAYLNLPWEIEARANQEKYIDQVWNVVSSTKKSKKKKSA